MLLSGDISARLGDGGGSTAIDTFDDQDHSEYVGDTGGWMFDTSTVYAGDAALVNDGDGRDQIRSTSGLDNYPAQGDTWEWRVRSSSTGVTDDPTCWYMFGVQDTDNYYIIRLDWENYDLYIEKSDGGSTSFIHDSSGDPTWLSASSWFRMELEWDDGSGFDGTQGAMRVVLSDPSTSDSTTVTCTGANADNTWQSGGVGWDKAIWNGSSTWIDEATLL